MVFQSVPALAAAGWEALCATRTLATHCADGPVPPLVILKVSRPPKAVVRSTVRASCCRSYWRSRRRRSERFLSRCSQQPLSQVRPGQHADRELVHAPFDHQRAGTGEGASPGREDLFSSRVAFRLLIAVMCVRFTAPPGPEKMSAKAAWMLGSVGLTDPVLLKISRKASRSPCDRVMYAPPVQVKVASSEVPVRMSCRDRGGFGHDEGRKTAQVVRDALRIVRFLQCGDGGIRDDRGLEGAGCSAVISGSSDTPYRLMYRGGGERHSERVCGAGLGAAEINEGNQFVCRRRTDRLVNPSTNGADRRGGECRWITKGDWRPVVRRVVSTDRRSLLPQLVAWIHSRRLRW